MRRVVLGVLCATAMIAVGVGPVAGQDPSAVIRLGAGERIGTAITISGDLWPAGTATSAVLARADVAADSLAATPLAAEGPLLLSASDTLPDAVAIG